MKSNKPKSNRRRGSAGRPAKIKNQNNNNNNNKQMVVSHQGKKHVQVSAPCVDYCHALCNPFDSPAVGMPTFPSLPTLKQKVYSRGTAYTGTAGVGFVTLRPNQACVNDVPSVWYTAPTYSAVIIDHTTSSSATSNSMFSLADIDPDGTSVRIVASGLRVRYGGTELNRGGFKVCLVDPTHQTLQGRNEASLNSELQAKRVAVTRQWTSLVYRPVTTSEISFTGTISTNGSGYMGVMMVSPDPSIAELFEWEAFTIVEYQGANARGQTHTDPDPIGYAAVSAVANKTNGIMTVPSSSAAKEMTTAVSHYIAHGISGVNDVVASADRAIATASSVVNTASKAWTIFEDVFAVAAPLLALI